MFIQKSSLFIISFYKKVCACRPFFCLSYSICYIYTYNARTFIRPAQLSQLLIGALFFDHNAMNYKQIKKLYGLEDKDIADIFGYKSAASFFASSAKNRIINAIVILHSIFTSNRHDDSQNSKT